MRGFQPVRLGSWTGNSIPRGGDGIKKKAKKTGKMSRGERDWVKKKKRIDGHGGSRTRASLSRTEGIVKDI